MSAAFRVTDADEAALLAAEDAVWRALVSGDAEADAALLAPDFLGVYPDGFAGREAHAAQLSGGPAVISYALSEVNVRMLAPDLGLVAYRADFARPGRGDEAMFVSSIWRRAGAGWLNVFSQDTPVVAPGA